MSFARFRGIIDQIKDHACVVDLSNWGDPLLAPEIHEMIRYAHDARIWTYISSNLHAFRAGDGQAVRMVESGLDMLSCSLHAATQTAYETYQPGKRLDLVISNIRTILEARRSLRARTPRVQLFFVVTRHNEHEMGDFRALAGDLGCEAVFSPASLNLRFVGRGRNLEDLGWSSERKCESASEICSEWLPRDDGEWLAPCYRAGADRGEKGRGSRKQKVYPCDWPWRGAVINWDGSVSVCCGVFDPRWEMGNVVAEPLRRIWNNDAYRAARRSFRRVVAGPAGKPCKGCPGTLV